MKPVSVALLAFSLFSALVTMTGANEFLKVSAHQGAERIRKDDIRESLLEEIDKSVPDDLDTSSASKLYDQLEATLQPIFAALPKNQLGNLDHIAANYALHRLFVSRHGWVIKGLSPVSGKYNSSSPAEVLKDQVPSYIEDVFEQHLGGKGYQLHDLAVLAATIEHLIQDESIQRIGAAFKIHNDGSGLLSSWDASQ